MKKYIQITMVLLIFIACHLVFSMEPPKKADQPAQSNEEQSYAKMSKSGQLVTYSWKNVSGHAESVQQERELWMLVFEHAYKDFTAEMLNVPDKAQFLKELFDKEEEEMKDTAAVIYWRTATVNGKIVGFASFHKEHKDDEMYIHLLAIHPLFQGCGIGKELVFSILKRFPTIKRLLVITRMINKDATDFYTRLGFHTSLCLPEGVGKEYIGYEYFSCAVAK